MGTGLRRRQRRISSLYQSPGKGRLDYEPGRGSFSDCTSPRGSGGLSTTKEWDTGNRDPQPSVRLTPVTERGLPSLSPELSGSPHDSQTCPPTPSTFPPRRTKEGREPGIFSGVLRGRDPDTQTFSLPSLPNPSSPYE